MSQSIYVIMRKRSDGKILLEMEKCGGRFFLSSDEAKRHPKYDPELHNVFEIVADFADETLNAWLEEI